MGEYTFVVGPVWTEAHSGDDAVLRKLLSVPDPAAANDPSARDQLWDGRHHFFDSTLLRFPSGLMPRLVRRLGKRGHKVSWLHDPALSPRLPVQPLDCLEGVDMREHQVEGVNLALEHRRGVLWQATNAGKTEQIAAITGALTAAGHQVLIIVPNTNILHEVRGRLRKRLGEDAELGRLGDGHKELGRQVTIASYQSLQSAFPTKGRTDFRTGKRKKGGVSHDPRVAALVRSVGAVLVDEAHHASARVYQELLRMAEAAEYRLGFTGTVEQFSRRDGEAADKVKDKARLNLWMVESAIGPVLQHVTNEYLIDKGYSARPRIYVVDDRAAFGPDVATQKYKKLPNGKMVESKDVYGATFARAATMDQAWLRSIVRVVRTLIRCGKPPFVFSHSIDHLKAIEAVAVARGVPVRLLHGEHNTSIRDDVVAEFAQGQAFAILSSTIFDEGANVPQIRAVVFAGARKSVREVLQRLGRGIRAKADDNTVIVVDFRPSHCAMLLDHAEERIAIYKHEGFKVSRIRDISRLAEVEF